MRRTTSRPVTVVAVAAAALLVAGCSAQDGGGTSDGRASGGGPSSPSVSASASPSPSASPSGPGASSQAPSPSTGGTGCTTEAQLTAADSGRTVCLRVGGQLRLTLDGTKDRPWSTVTATGGALKPTNAGIVVLPGDAVAAYHAVAPGTARLTSTRPLCARHPGQKACLGIQQWTVTVTVEQP
jgi:hypothetical protein